MIRSNKAGVLLRHGALAVPRRADPPTAFLRYRLRGGSISPAAVDALASAIQTHEGFYPGSIAWQNNNPGNLIYVGQPGATLGAGGFAKFSTYDQGLAAVKNQITLDATRGTDANGNPVTNVSELLNSWAPGSDPRNDPASYVSAVSAQTGYDPFAPLSSLGSSTSTSSAVSVDSSLLPAVYSPDYGLSFLDPGSSPVENVDLSSVGLPAVPVPALVAGGLVGVLLLSRLF